MAARLLALRASRTYVGKIKVLLSLREDYVRVEVRVYNDNVILLHHFALCNLT
jgi:hypothetical protein